MEQRKSDREFERGGGGGGGYDDYDDGYGGGGDDEGSSNKQLIGLVALALIVVWAYR